MTRAELEALALRVEREEPSAELGIAVAAACGKVLSRFGTGDDAVYVNPMRYLRSLDAAVTLMSNYYEWAVDDGGEASVRNVKTGVQSTGFVMDRPAAALTAAALRAQAAQE